MQEIRKFFSLSDERVTWILAAKQAALFLGLMVWPRLSDSLGRQSVLLCMFLPLALAEFAQVNAATVCCAPHPSHRRAPPSAVCHVELMPV